MPYSYTEERVRDYFLDEPCGVDMVLGQVEVWLITGPPHTESFQHSTQLCVPAPWPMGNPPPGVNPVDATSAQAIIQEYLPLPEVALSPDAHGITGMEVWLWHPTDASLEPIDHDGDPSTPDKPGLTVTATDGPYSISATVWIDRYAWDLGDGSTVTATRAGDRGDPAATHTYTTSNPDYEITAHAIWAGRYSWTSPFDAATDLDMGELEVASAPRPYPVYEVHAVPADG
ncbi:MAG: hypothetical protein R3320_13095 [Nitriliruptorales bacterium]|nr:hypothetical protein [Nitriliruptorales bacterium]